jgi:hypothetical protein
MPIANNFGLVRLMGQIYTKAALVIVWLGEDDGSMSEAIKCMEHFSTFTGHTAELQDLKKLDLMIQTFCKLEHGISRPSLSSSGSCPRTRINARLSRYLPTIPGFTAPGPFQKSFLAPDQQFHLKSFTFNKVRLWQALLMVSVLYRVTKARMFNKIDSQEWYSMISAKYALVEHTRLRQLMWEKKGSGCKQHVDLVAPILFLTSSDETVN